LPGNIDTIEAKAVASLLKIDPSFDVAKLPGLSMAQRAEVLQKELLGYEPTVAEGMSSIGRLQEKLLQELTAQAQAASARAAEFQRLATVAAEAHAGILERRA
jgi:hypothetical protein